MVPPPFPLRFGSDSVNTHLLFVLSETLKGDSAVYLGKYGVVFSKPYIIAGVYFRASLANKDIPGPHFLAGKPFNAISLAGTVSSIPGASACLFVCHFLYLL